MKAEVSNNSGIYYRFKLSLSEKREVVRTWNKREVIIHVW